MFVVVIEVESWFRQALLGLLLLLLPMSPLMQLGFRRWGANERSRWLDANIYEL